MKLKKQVVSLSGPLPDLWEMCIFVWQAKVLLINKPFREVQASPPGFVPVLSAGSTGPWNLPMAANRCKNMGQLEGSFFFLGGGGGGWGLPGPAPDLQLPTEVPGSQRDLEGQVGMVAWRT